jgi:hypothetical protein
MNNFCQEGELSDSIYSKLCNLKLVGRPLIITGYLCVSTGVSFMNKNLGSFTTGIFTKRPMTGPKNKRGIREYQNLGRTFGRIIDSKKTIIYCSKKFHDECVLKNKIPETLPGKEIRTIEKSDVDNLISNCNTDCDKEYRVFNNERDAVEFAKTTLNKHINMSRDGKAPKELQDVDGQNPTIESIITRFWGIHDKIPVRKVPTYDGKWCLYWRPSSLLKWQKDKK